MVYPTDYESRIGFDIIRAQCEALCTMHRGVELLCGQTFCESSKEISKRLALADQMRQMLTIEIGAPTEDFYDIADLVDKIKVEGLFLDIDEVVRLRATLSSTADMVAFVGSRKKGLYPDIEAITQGVGQIAHIVAQIDKIIDDKGQVRDSASVELSNIRREIRNHEGQVAKKLQAVLQAAKSLGVVDTEATISIREGRAVIPVSATNKRKLQGFIHDESATGKTFYIEPVEVVELNNHLKELEYAQRREIVKILTALTAFIATDADTIAGAEQYIATIDMVRAKARWAIQNGATKPLIAENNDRLNLRQAKHPLLAQTLAQNGRTLVPLNATLDANNRILVISGPNAGGKSVCLKTFALLQYMFQCGFLIPVLENSELPIFKKIFIDIGDQQSIENDLSTYSSHLINMKAMLAGADNNSIIFIDEFGTGTEPIMGASIAESVLEKLVESGCYGVITTHYSNIKYFASSAVGVINGAMAFDVQNICPLFVLEQGKPGSSFAIEIARKIGLPEQIIKSAIQKVGTDHIDLEKQLREIARDKRYWEQKRDKIRLTDRKVEQLEQQYSTSLATIKEQRNQIIAAAKEQAKELVAQANRQIENTIKTIKESQAEKELTRLARNEFDKFKQQIEDTKSEQIESSEDLDKEMERLRRRQERRAERKNKPIQEPTTSEPIKKVLPLVVGAKVRLNGQAVIGVVQTINGKKASVAFGQIITMVAVDRLEVVSQGEYKKANAPTTPTLKISADISQRRLNFKQNIDIRGMRVTEALEAVQALVDDAVMVGVNSVTILHGKGTGALKEEVRRYLRTIPEVESATDAHPDRGGSGITEVKFKI